MTATEFVWLVIGILAGMILEHIRADLAAGQVRGGDGQKPPS